MLLPEPENAGVEYNKETFRPILLEDMRGARHYVLIQSPFLKLQLLKLFLHEISQCIQRGVVVCLFVCQPEGWDIRRDLLSPITKAEFDELQGIIDMLVAIGVHVNLRRDIHKKLAVIDGLILYYGSLNFFSYGKSTDSTRRYDIPALALNAVETEKLFCDVCRPDAAQPPERVAVISTNSSLGDWVCKLREGLGLGQRTMASKAGTTRSRLDDIEKEKVSVPLRIFANLCRVAGLEVLVVPQYAVAAVKRLVALMPAPKE